MHLGSVAVTDAEGSMLASVGDPERVTFARSSMKPLQATVSVTLAGDDLDAREVAVACASHNGEPVHVATVRGILERAGLDVGSLRCPPSLPIDQASALEAGEARPEYHNCSGKHAAMLLACVRRGFAPETYVDVDHPLQAAVLEAVRAAAGEPHAVGVDGCGVPVHALPLSAMATLFARLAAGRLEGSPRIVEAMLAEPYLVAGRDRVCTAVMEGGQAIVKVGAEGLVCAGLPDRGIGVAIKIEDGAARALDPAIVQALVSLGACDPDRVEAFARPAVKGGGRRVGELVPAFDLPSV